MNTPIISLRVVGPRRLTIYISRAWARCYFRLLAVWLVVYTLQTIIDLVRHQ